MTTLTDKQRADLALVVHAVLDAVQVAGEHGAPAGVLYAGLMSQGCTLTKFQSLMAAIVRKGLITHDEHSHL